MAPRGRPTRLNPGATPTPVTDPTTTTSVTSAQLQAMINEGVTAVLAALSWKSKKHATLSRSSTKANYRSMTSATCKVTWILQIMKDLNVKSLVPVNLYSDNKSAMQIAANPIMHEKIKHFDIDVHFVREKVSSRLIGTLKVDSKKNINDILTKALRSFQLGFLTKKLGTKLYYWST
ncbi:ribonuclease H-like domain-containing protein [Tanacetum coccineum]|uniref:Ribonuclease H-like domain-containing protein n=1 Tax=Tanacetum coccineum TaxID=301880 RepID=A0ABQ4Y715_9ASTR